VTFVSSPDIDRILEANGHVVVTGGPGCGKTTVALRKAFLRIEEGLLPGQKVLFLSFSRAAVARIEQAARTDLLRAARANLDIQTFHSFCWQLVRGYGYLLGAPKKISLLAPHDERALRDGETCDDPAWSAELERLFLLEGRLAFDLFAPKALEILKGSRAFRLLVADQYPLIIIDEAQDTGSAQWSCVAELKNDAQLICLADLDQQIYDFRSDVSPNRLSDIVNILNPLVVNLGTQNNRSPGKEIVSFGNDILNNTPHGTTYRGVGQRQFRPTSASRDVAIRQAIGMVGRVVEASTGYRPRSIGYVTSWGKGVAVIARALQGGEGQREIPHRIILDEVEVLLSTRVVALCLEPISDIWQTLATGIDLIADVYRSRGNRAKVEMLRRAASDARLCRLRGRARCPIALNQILRDILVESHSGEPGADWLYIRRRFEESGVEELMLIARSVIYLMAFNRGRRIVDSLVDAWQRHGSYSGARVLIEAAIAEDQIMGGADDTEGINVMTVHKSKGKEFDGVILFHAAHISPFSPDSESAPHAKSRRLLRVGVTRARHHALLLADAFSPSPLLRGHELND
jgi:DNA helicase-2/ATP-dependent DNA helicase PcrA